MPCTQTCMPMHGRWGDVELRATRPMKQPRRLCDSTRQRRDTPPRRIAPVAERIGSTRTLKRCEPHNCTTAISEPTRSRQWQRGLQGCAWPCSMSIFFTSEAERCHATTSRRDQPKKAPLSPYAGLFMVRGGSIPSRASAVATSTRTQASWTQPHRNRRRGASDRGG